MPTSTLYGVPNRITALLDAFHRVRLIALEQEWLEIRYWHLFDEQERGGWITKNGRHILIGEDSGSGGGKSGKSVDNSGESGIIESKKITPATEQEIADFKASLLEMGFTDVTGFENYTKSNEHLLEIIEDFGKLKADFPDYFKGLKLDFGTVKEMTDNDYAGYVPGTGTIHLNPVFYNNFEKMQKEYSSDVSKKYHPAGTDYRANIFHEFGHRVEHIDGISPKKIAKKVYEAHNKRYYTRKLCDSWITENLSSYVIHYDYEDLISESFAELYGSRQPRKLCSDVIKQITRGV